MSKKGRPAVAPPTAPAPLEPSRTLGLLILLVSIIFTVVWLTRESVENAELSKAASIKASALPENLAGFNADTWFLPSDSTWGFVEIPAGQFTMGSDPRVDSLAYGNEQWSRSLRQGKVTLPAFYISRFETTVAQFKAYLAATGRPAEGVNLDRAGNYPVTGVTWPEALAYGRWLETQLRNAENTPSVLQQFLSDGGQLTLPSEAQWEKAARGIDGRVFPWGSAPRTDMANYNSNGLLIVGALACAPCSYGLSDMSGNVWEMTRSPLQDYPYNSNDDLEDLSADAIWVMRGGSYLDAVSNVRAAVRGGIDPGVRNQTIGFRVAISRTQ
ncbi:MAG: sulfatase activating formylglycine-generating enzyme [Pseudohongiellaceae bacterium]|jgi:formylglycine-generating enzyme required for sulfatase activity